MLKRRRLSSAASLVPSVSKGLAVLAGLAVAAPAVSAQEPDLVTVPPVPRDYRPASTAWGEPDLRGTWPIDHLNFTPLQRPPEQAGRYLLTDEEFAARQRMLAERGEAYAKEIEDETIGMGHWVEPGTANRRTSFLIDPPDGRLPPLTEEGKRLQALKRSSYIPGQTYDSPADFDIWDRCISRGLPASMFPFNYNNGIRIFQAPGLVAIQMEMVHETRIIPTAAPASRFSSRTGSAKAAGIGKMATRWSSRPPTSIRNPLRSTSAPGARPQATTRRRATRRSWSSASP